MNRRDRRVGHPLRAGALLLIALFVVISVLAGCSEKKPPTGEQTRQSAAPQSAEPTNTASQTPGSDPTISESKQGDFVYRLIVEPPQGDGAEGKPKLSAELEYVGDKDEIAIRHEASPFYFFLKETTRDYDIGYSMDQPLIVTKLKRGEPFKETYAGGAGDPLSKDKELEAFVKALWESGFPPGQYEATGQAHFYTEEDGKKQDYKIEGKVTFAVDQ